MHAWLLYASCGTSLLVKKVFPNEHFCIGASKKRVLLIWWNDWPVDMHRPPQRNTHILPIHGETKTNTCWTLCASIPRHSLNLDQRPAGAVVGTFFNTCTEITALPLRPLVLSAPVPCSLRGKATPGALSGPFSPAIDLHVRGGGKARERRFRQN
jgi:hypothetical protein